MFLSLLVNPVAKTMKALSNVMQTILMNAEISYDCGQYNKEQLKYDTIDIKNILPITDFA